MSLTFTKRFEYGRNRFYSANTLADALLTLCKRKCFHTNEIETLKQAGFEVRIETENV